MRSWLRSLYGRDRRVLELTPRESFKAHRQYWIDMDGPSREILDLVARRIIRINNACDVFGHLWHWTGDIIDGDIHADTFVCTEFGCQRTKTVYNGTDHIEYGRFDDMVLLGMIRIDSLTLPKEA